VSSHRRLYVIIHVTYKIIFVNTLANQDVHSHINFIGDSYLRTQQLQFVEPY